jgi:hypothetical protein
MKSFGDIRCMKVEQGTNYAHDGSSEYIRNVDTIVPVYTTIGVTLGGVGGKVYSSCLPL